MATGASEPSRGRVLVGGEEYQVGNDRPRRVIEDTSKWHPQTPREACEVLASQVGRLADDVQAMPASLRGDRVVFEARLLPNYLASSYYPEELMAQFGLRAVGSRLSYERLSMKREPDRPAVETKTMLFSAPVAGIGDLRGRIDESLRPDSDVLVSPQIREFAAMELSPEASVVRLPLPGDEDNVWPDAWEAILHPDPDLSSADILRPIGERNFAKFLHLVESMGGETLVDWSHQLSGLTFVPVIVPGEVVRELAAFNILRSISPMPRLRSHVSAPLRRWRAPAPVAPARKDTTGLPNILVFDGGIDSAQSVYLESFVDVIEASEHPQDPNDAAHGTAVTASVLYGEVLPGQQLDSPAATVTHYRVTPCGGDVTELYELLDKIVDIIEDLPPGQIVNLSMGPKLSVRDGEVHRWTATLDDLAARRDCLFIVACGNNGDDDPVGGYNRIESPADMVNGLSVGAYGSRDVTKIERAPYSAVGPGRPGARVQPAGVAFGGSINEPFLCLSGDGTFTYDHGTSYATPLVTHAIAGLIREWGQRPSAAAMRAVAIHFAEPVGNHTDFGWGRFRPNFEDLFDHPTNHVTVLSELAVTREGLHSIPLPIAGSVPGNVNVRTTIALTSPVEATEAVDYTTLGVTVTMRPHAGRLRFSDPENPTKARVVDVTSDPDLHRDLLQRGWKQPANPVSRPTKLPDLLELTRRELDGKWETVLQFQDRLRATSLFNPRIDLDFVSRTRGLLTRPRESVPVVVISTVTAKVGVNLYGEVRNAFPMLTPVGTEIRAQV